MKQFFCITNDHYADGLTAATGHIEDLASMAAGSFAMIAKDPTGLILGMDHIVDLANASAPTTLVKKFQLAYRGLTANVGLQYTPIFDRSLIKITKTVHAHAQAKVITIGTTPNLPTLEAGQVAGFVLRDKRYPLGTQLAEKSYTYTLITGDNAAAMWAGLVAVVNADTKCPVTASGGTSSLILTADTAGVDFEVSVVGILQLSSKVQTTATITGTGIPADLVVIEKDAAVDRGLENGKQSLLYTHVTDIDATKFYDLFVITQKMPNLRGVDFGTNEEYQLTIAIDEALSTTTPHCRYALNNLYDILNTNAVIL